jgi:metal-dependent amidase/aminoacylase/carboxypeptidase family protein
MIEAFSGFPRAPSSKGRGATATVIHASVGEEAFGTTPGRGRILITLRAHDNETMSFLSGEAAGLASEIARVHGLEPDISWTEEFPATVNDPLAASMVSLCASKLGMEVIYREEPFPWSEDFGNYADMFPAALFGLGAGSEHPALHSPDYDFPDELLVPGVDLLMEIVDRALDEGRR